MLDKHPQIFRPLDHNKQGLVLPFRSIFCKFILERDNSVAVVVLLHYKPDEVSENVIKQIAWTMKAQLELTMTLYRL